MNIEDHLALTVISFLAVKSLNIFFIKILIIFRNTNIYLMLKEIFKRKMNKLTVVKLHYKLKFKYKKKRHKVFNIKISNDTVFFFLNLKNEEKINKKIATLFKKIISKIFKSE